MKKTPPPAIPSVRLPDPSLNIPTLTEARSSPLLQRVRDSIHSVQTQAGLEADIVIKLDFTRVHLHTARVEQGIGAPVVDSTLLLLRYALGSPLHHSAGLFDLVRHLYELPAGSEDRCLTDWM